MRLPRKQIPVSSIRELDEFWHGDDEPPTWRAITEHMTLIDEADLIGSYAGITPSPER